MNRLSLLLLALWATAPSRMLAQVSELGGCAAGTERGYVRVLRSSPLLEYLTDEQFAMAEPGDVFRMCTANNRFAVVTLVGRGVGFRLRRAAVEILYSLPTINFTSAEFTRLACEIARIQATAGGMDAQNRAFLPFARANHITFVMILQIREEALDRGIYSSPGRCGP